MYMAFCLILIVVGMIGCRPAQISSATVTAKPLPKISGWLHVDLPPNCSFHELSPNLQWLLFRCDSNLEKRSTDWIAAINDEGKIENVKSLEGRFTLLGDDVYAIGFTRDNSLIIVRRKEAFSLVNPSDLIEQPYSTSVLGVSGVNVLGSERWSPDGQEYLTFDRMGLEEISIVWPEHGTDDVLLKNLGRHATQVNWCANNNEIVYVDGQVGENMRAQIIDLQSRQPRMLLESQFPSSITGASCSPDGKWIVVRQQQLTSDETTLWFIDRTSNSTSQYIYQLENGPDAYGDAWNDLLWSPDGSMLALRGSTSHAGDGFTVIEVPTGQIAFEAGTARYLQPLAWSADSTSVLTLGFRSNDATPDFSYFLEWIRIRP
jgi:hypothetical protein